MAITFNSSAHCNDCDDLLTEIQRAAQNFMKRARAAAYAPAPVVQPGEFRDRPDCNRSLLRRRAAVLVLGCETPRSRSACADCARAVRHWARWAAGSSWAVRGCWSAAAPARWWPPVSVRSAVQVLARSLALARVSLSAAVRDNWAELAADDPIAAMKGLQVDGAAIAARIPPAAALIVTS